MLPKFSVYNPLFFFECTISTNVESKLLCTQLSTLAFDGTRYYSIQIPLVFAGTHRSISNSILVEYTIAHSYSFQLNRQIILCKILERLG